MKNSLLLLLITCSFGCSQHETRRAVLKIDPAMEESFKRTPVRLGPNGPLEPFIGERVELVGVVNVVGIPRLQGVDLPELERFRGKPVLVSGVLHRVGAAYRLQYLAYGCCM
jgi:hypothetical protein